MRASRAAPEARLLQFKSALARAPALNRSRGLPHAHANYVKQRSLQNHCIGNPRDLTRSHAKGRVLALRGASAPQVTSNGEVEGPGTHA